MKKKLIISVFGVITIVVILFFMWPLSFANVFNETADDAEMLILITIPFSDSEEYSFLADSEVFMQIQGILSNYSYRRSFRTLFGDSSMRGNDAGYWVHFYLGERSIITGGTNEILVNASVYRLWPWGNSSNIKMMNEVRGVLVN